MPLRVVLATNGSQASYAALLFLPRLFGPKDTVILYRCYSLPSSLFLSPEEHSVVCRRAATTVQRSLDEFKHTICRLFRMPPDSPNVQAVSEVKSNARNALIAFVEHCGADVVVAGSRGIQRWAQYVVGSFTRTLASGINNIPLLLVRIPPSILRSPSDRIPDCVLFLRPRKLYVTALIDLSCLSTESAFEAVSRALCTALRRIGIANDDVGSDLSSVGISSPMNPEVAEATADQAAGASQWESNPNHQASNNRAVRGVPHVVLSFVAACGSLSAGADEPVGAYGQDSSGWTSHEDGVDAGQSTAGFAAVGSAGGLYYVVGSAQDYKAAVSISASQTPSHLDSIDKGNGCCCMKLCCEHCVAVCACGRPCGQCAAELRKSDTEFWQGDDVAAAGVIPFVPTFDFETTASSRYESQYLRRGDKVPVQTLFPRVHPECVDALANLPSICSRCGGPVAVEASGQESPTGPRLVDSFMSTVGSLASKSMGSLFDGVKTSVESVRSSRYVPKVVKSYLSGREPGSHRSSPRSLPTDTGVAEAPWLCSTCEALPVPVLMCQRGHPLRRARASTYMTFRTSESMRLRAIDGAPSEKRVRDCSLPEFLRESRSFTEIPSAIRNPQSTSVESTNSATSLPTDAVQTNPKSASASALEASASRPTISVGSGEYVLALAARDSLGHIGDGSGDDVPALAARDSLSLLPDAIAKSACNDTEDLGLAAAVSTCSLDSVEISHTARSPSPPLARLDAPSPTAESNPSPPPGTPPVTSKTEYISANPRPAVFPSDGELFCDSCHEAIPVPDDVYSCIRCHVELCAPCAISASSRVVLSMGRHKYPQSCATGMCRFTAGHLGCLAAVQELVSSVAFENGVQARGMLLTLSPAEVPSSCINALRSFASARVSDVVVCAQPHVYRMAQRSLPSPSLVYINTSAV